jgi:hypothetical protein
LTVVLADILDLVGGRRNRPRGYLKIVETVDIDRRLRELEGKSAVQK